MQEVEDYCDNLEYQFIAYNLDDISINTFSQTFLNLTPCKMANCNSRECVSFIKYCDNDKTLEDLIGEVKRCDSNLIDVTKYFINDENINELKKLRNRFARLQ